MSRASLIHLNFNLKPQLQPPLPHFLVPTNKLFLISLTPRVFAPTYQLHLLVLSRFRCCTFTSKGFHASATMGKRNRTTSQDSVPTHPVPQNSKEVVTEDGQEYTAVTEGLATILFPKTTIKKDKSGKDIKVEGHVFYNPIQQFNRDLSVLAIKAFGDIYLEEKRAKKEEKLKRAKGKINDNSEAKPMESALQVKAKLEASREGQGPKQEQEVEEDVQLQQPELESASTAKPEDPMDVAPPRGPFSTTHIWRPQPPKFTILDALSATGLRALRYALEIPAATSITANDLDPSATASISHNITYNTAHSTTTIPETLSPSAAMSKIRVSLANASHHMYSVLSPPHLDANTPIHLRSVIAKYEVIDLDPFGSAAPFLDAAVQAVSDGGLLCVTCTDAGVWASTGYSEKCFALYGGIPVKGEWSHEAGIRIIVNAVAMSAARYGCWIEPLLSLSIDFYARIFVRVRRGPDKLKRLASTTMVVYNCDEGCGSWVLQKLGRMKEETNRSGTGTFCKYGLSRAPTTDANCRECGFPMHLAGPMWAGPLHSPEFITRFLAILPPVTDSTYATIPRITGMLQTALQESALADAPFFFATTRLAKTLHCESPPLAGFRGALKGLGYKVARSHCKPTSIKTDAPWNVLWEVMRRWVEKKPIKEGTLGAKQAGYEILRIERKKKALEEKREVELTEEEEKLAKLEVKFDEVLGRDEDKVGGVVRYQINPTANWGPMAKKEGVAVIKEDGGETAGAEKHKRESEETEGEERPAEKKVKAQAV